LSDLRRATERIEREEFARGHIGPDELPVVPRPAATIVIAWAPPDDGPYQVLLLRRPDSARFAAGAYVFAGGVIDDSDGTPKALELLPEAMRETEGAAAVAALREMFEETGILPGHDTVDPRKAEEIRARLLAGECDFVTAASHLGASFHGLRAAYLSRWITPARFARRYDTRFFLTVLEAPAAPTPALTDELDGYLWICPADAVRMFAAGELPMLFPTRRTLQVLSGETDLARLLERYEGQEPEGIEPRLLVRGDSVRPVLPGDPEYEEAGR
jgi:8-oxo-dGTP pyrophosphatase MutT (NUDIX family)